ncbi:putative ribonuclease H protein [Senna tora]|uniref:Putative ribonuclease H protein n=1 Tax=Senna tora TaxID=362788 RepID=A0A834X1N6_9FABA|nr:putative ribonuclease H protein [Senna tora]
MTHFRHMIRRFVGFPKGMHQVNVPVAINQTPNLMNKARTRMVFSNTIHNQLQNNLRVTFNDNFLKTLIPMQEICLFISKKEELRPQIKLKNMIQKSILRKKFQ